MTKRKCGCEYATAKNTPAVRHGYEMGGYLLHACEQHMAPQPAPLLTAEMAEDLLFRAQRHPAELGALADGRTACVRVMSEEECRAKFEAHFKAGGYQYSDSNKANAFGWWLACARATGLVKP